MSYFIRNGYTEISENEFNKDETIFIESDSTMEIYKNIKNNIEYIKYYYKSELSNIYKKKINCER